MAFTASIVLCLGIFIGSSLPLSDASEDHHSKLLLISMDGFGWNFLNKLPQSELVNFNKFIEKGVHVRWIENVFPTNTRTNHMSMVTGLYPESHGMVDNQMFDPSLNASMPEFLSVGDSRWVKMFPGIEPVWITNMKHRDGHASGTIYWPGADPQEFRPDNITGGEWSVTEETDPPNARIDRALEWLKGPCNFVAVYLNDPDEVSHVHGPDSQEVLDMIRSRDAVVGHLLKRLEEDEDFGKLLNIIITADHGQQQIYESQMINLDDYIESTWYTPVPSLENEHTVVNIWPTEGHYQHIVDKLTKTHILNLHVQTKSDSADLAALHYANNRRIAPIVVFAEPGWVIKTSKTVMNQKGQHGYDPRFAPSMYPLFIAKGPAFLSGKRDLAPFSIVDVYDVMCYVLGITPNPNNGSLLYAEHIMNLQLKHDSTFSLNHKANYTVVGITVILLILIVVAVVVIVRYVRMTRNVTASYKRTFARAGTGDELVADEGTVILSDDDDF